MKKRKKGSLFRVIIQGQLCLVPYPDSGFLPALPFDTETFVFAPHKLMQKGKQPRWPDLTFDLNTFLTERTEHQGIVYFSRYFLNPRIEVYLCGNMYTAILDRIDLDVAAVFADILQKQLFFSGRMDLDASFRLKMVPS